MRLRYIGSSYASLSAEENNGLAALSILWAKAGETSVNIGHDQTRAQSEVISHRLYNGACGSPVLIDLVFGNLHYFPYYQSIGLV